LFNLSKAITEKTIGVIMGVGIGAVVPLKVSIKSWDFDNNMNNLKIRYFHNDFFSFFNGEKRDNGYDGYYVFTIKSDFLLANYKDFLCEFYQLIGEDLFERTKISSEDDILKLKEIDSFIAAFNQDARGDDIPYICSSLGMVSTLGCKCLESWLFYFGSYKACLEVYTTFIHFERILVKAMKNPLAKIVKFCEYG
jgi:hypothetical protein